MMDYLQLNQYKKVKTFFDKDSSRYLEERYKQEGANCGTMAYISRENIVLKMIDSASGLWLDAGCGPGPLIPDLLRKGLRVVGADLSLDMIELASKNLREQGGSGVHFSVNNVDSLSFRDNSFDGVAAIGVLSYIPDIQTTLREINRVLKPRGIAILQISNRRSLPEAEIRFLIPLWNFLKKRCSNPEGEKVQFSWNPFSQFDLHLRAYYAGDLDRVCRFTGFRKIASEYYDFRFPLIWKIFPRFSANFSAFLSKSRRSKYFSILASGYILKVEKVT
jgi:ubiquinone/menaquinone biosynthesis C-methylase UbiE